MEHDMRTIRFRTEQIVPITEQRLKDFEKLIGTTLPTDYRSYLERFAGADPYIVGFDHNDSYDEGYFVRIQWDGKPAATEGTIALLEWRYTLLEDPNDENDMGHCNDLRYAYKTFKGRIPDDTIIIWDSGGPNHFLLGIKGQNRNKIFMWSWSYEHGDEDVPATYDNVAFVANSFNEFIQMIEPIPLDWDAWEAAGKPHLPLKSDKNP
jgi:hypothetical protein